MMNKRRNEEISFLAGPRSRWAELKYLFGVSFEFIKGFQKLHFVGPCITVFGSARFQETHPYYALTRQVSAELAKLDYSIMTGGGPGIMEAANRGAKDVGGQSLGCNIVLPREQYVNPYIDRHVTIEYFFVRKALLRKYSFAFIVMPGGFGTLDEFFETITLVQTGKTENFPIVIMGKDYHKDLMEHISRMAEEGTISKSDLQLILFTDNVSEVIEHIQKFAELHKGKKLQYRKRKPIRLFGEQ